MLADRRSVLRWLGIGAAAAPVVGTGIVYSVKDAQADLAKELPKGFKDPYHIPADMIPKGAIYNWKRVFITADEPDFENIAAMVEQGWKPVPTARHPDLFRIGVASSDVNPSGFSRSWIEVGGLVLMEKRGA
jgi:hypothetical protein